MTFSKTFLLEQHIQEFHEKRRPFDCEVCQKKFFRKKHLLVHNTSTYHKKRVAWSQKENKENLAPKNLSNNPSSKPSTGKSLSEALLFAEHGENMLFTKIVLSVRNNFCTQHVLPRFELGIFMY